MSTKAASGALSTTRQYFHLNNASFHGRDKLVGLHRWVHLPRLSAGSNAFMGTNVPEILFSKVTEPIQMERTLQKRSTDMGLKSAVGLTKFYC